MTETDWVEMLLYYYPLARRRLGLEAAEELVFRKAYEYLWQAGAEPEVTRRILARVQERLLSGEAG